MTRQIKMTLLILNTVYAHRHRNSAVWRSSPHAVCINVSLFISFWRLSDTRHTRKSQCI